MFAVKILRFYALIIFSFLFIIRTTVVFSQNIGLKILSVSDRGCAPLNICFQNTSDSAGIERFEWDFNNDGIADETYGPENAGQTVCHTFNNKPFQNRVFLVGVKTDDSKDGAFVTIFVYHPNNAAIGNLPSLICSGSIDLTNNSIINDDGIVHFTSWDFGDGSPIEITTQTTISHEFISEGNLTVTMIDSNSCGTSITTRNIEIDLLNAEIQSGTGNEACQGELIEFTNIDHEPNLMYSWNPGDGSQNISTAIAQHRYLTSGNYTINLQVSIPDGTGCIDTNSFDIEVRPGPIAEFSLGFQPGCDSLKVDFTDYSTEVLPGDEYLWTFGNGDTSTGKTVASKIIYDSAGYYYPVLTLTRNSNSCSSSYTDTLLVPSTPTAVFVADNVCVGQTAVFTDVSSSGINPITNWSWDFGGLSSSLDRNPSAIFNTPGPLLVNLTVSTGYCSNSFNNPIIVEDLPHPDFAPSVLNGCSPLNVLFTNNTPDAESYQWIFGDQNKDTNVSPNHVFINNSENDTTYYTKLIAKTAFGCKDSVSAAIEVFRTPIAKFTSNAPVLPSCSPAIITFINNSEGADFLKWDFGDNTNGTDSVETHIFENHDHYFKHYEVKLITTSTNGCKDTSQSKYISINPKPRIDFIIDTSGTCHPASVNIYAPIESNASYFWDFGNGNTTNTQNYTVTQDFTNNGSQDTTYIVKLVTTSQFNCIDSIEKPLIIHPKPQANCSIFPNPANHLDTINFTNNSYYDSNWDYRWIFGNGNKDTVNTFNPAPRHFNDVGNILVELIVTTEHQCFDTLKDILYIIPPPPLLDFTIDTMQGCPPLEVTFTNSSLYTDTNTYYWNFGDGTYSNEVNPVHTFYDDGEINITLTASGLDKSEVSKDTTINIFKKPSSAFTVLPDEINIPDQSAHCVPNYPQAGESYNWDFGDNHSSQQQEPEHFYEDTGKFIITLIVISEKGCSDTLSKNIHAVSAGKIIVPNVFFPGFGSSGGGGGDGGIVSPISVDNSIFAPMSEGVVEYHLEIYTRWGEKIFSSNTKELGWTGYYQGKLCKEDVYVWKVYGKYSSGQVFNKAGTLTLLQK